MADYVLERRGLTGHLSVNFDAEDDRAARQEARRILAEMSPKGKEADYDLYEVKKRPVEIRPDIR